MSCHEIFTQKRKEVTVQSNLYVVAFRVVAEHKKKSTCMGASVPESVGEEEGRLRSSEQRVSALLHVGNLSFLSPEDP